MISRLDLKPGIPWVRIVPKEQKFSESFLKNNYEMFVFTSQSSSLLQCWLSKQIKSIKNFFVIFQF